MNKKVLTFYMITGLLILLTVQLQAQSSQLLSVSEFEKKLSATKDKIVLDVRTQGEYASGHLTNAMMIDYYKSDFKQQLTKLDKSTPVFVYCAAGGRSGSATEILTGMGFKQVFDLEGGMKAWTKGQKSIVK